MTYAFMGFLVLAMGIITLWGMKYESTKDSFMTKDDSLFLRGFWCIVVILVHIPAAYQNKIQDMVGSFAYVGVTFFFMTSSYGLKYSLEHKKGYMEHFWQRRIPPILLPAIIANAIQVLAYGLNGEPITPISFININAWVRVLLLYYLFFWLIYGVISKKIGKGIWQDIAMCLIVVACSLIDYFTNFKITSRWIVEPLGFAYGIIAAKYEAEIKKWISKNWIFKSMTLMIASLVFGIAYLKFKPLIFWGDYILKILLGATITAFILVLIGKIKVGNKANGFLGKISYEVYLLHHAVFALLMAVDKNTMNSGLFVISSVCITLVIAFCLRIICNLINRRISTIGG